MVSLTEEGNTGGRGMGGEDEEFLIQNVKFHVSPLIPVGSHRLKLGQSYRFPLEESVELWASEKDIVHEDTICFPSLFLSSPVPTSFL